MREREARWRVGSVTRGDLAALLAVNEAAGRERLRAASLRAALASGSWRALGAYDAAGRLAGYLCFSLAGPILDIRHVAVKPGRRRRGVGSALLAAARRLAAAGGAARVNVLARADNAAARALYREAGFQLDADDAVVLAGGKTLDRLSARANAAASASRPSRPRRTKPRSARRSRSGSRS